ncbi:hypothetical protein JTE90_021239 [Oedothorax gibbosus]|uniref:Uncharacterized protein n=1 Tax=Oedothorax gibbosus TaxID=931172 RepID=A0AAV6UWN4_9ARAC|nr:hypothetical protein JTE90_021239 [Oedothorax gibbosus]
MPFAASGWGGSNRTECSGRMGGYPLKTEGGPRAVATSEMAARKFPLLLLAACLLVNTAQARQQKDKKDIKQGDDNFTYRILPLLLRTLLRPIF